MGLWLLSVNINIMLKMLMFKREACKCLQITFTCGPRTPTHMDTSLTERNMMFFIVHRNLHIFDNYSKILLNLGYLSNPK